MSLNNQQQLRMLEKMHLTRKFEQKVEYLFSKGMLHGTTHLYIGQEATATGVITALKEKDLITSTHRGHGHCISKGMDVKVMMAELLGKETGCCKGRGGSMHVADIENGNLGQNGVVGGGQAIAVGAALTSKMKNQGKMVACFFGDGATNEGSWHEAANMAAIWNLPVLFVCENNLYGLSMHKSQAMNVENIEDRAKAFGFPGKTIDGNDVIEVYEETIKAREYVMQNGPMLLVCDTYRIMGHSKSDKNAYRSQQEIAHWKLKDPIDRMRIVMLDQGISESELAAVDTKTTEQIEDAVRFAQQSPTPSIDTIMDNVYA